MSQDSKTFLGANVLNDGKTVGPTSAYESADDSTNIFARYPTAAWAENSKCIAMSQRSAERSKLSENLADLTIRMLYEFYSIQTAKTPGSITAIYLLDGVSKAPNESGVNGHQQDGEDMHMQSSPYMSSSTACQDDHLEDVITSRNITLAKEEHLKGKMGMRFIGFAYFTTFELSTAEKVDRGKSKVQAYTFHTHLQSGTKQGAGKSTKPQSRFQTMPTVTESTSSVRLQQSDIREIRV